MEEITKNFVLKNSEARWLLEAISKGQADTIESTDAFFKVQYRGDIYTIILSSKEKEGR